jgi:hypothetical protein
MTIPFSGDNLRLFIYGSMSNSGVICFGGNSRREGPIRRGKAQDPTVDLVLSVNRGTSSCCLTIDHLEPTAIHAHDSISNVR